MNRAQFLRSLVGAGAGLLAGNEALEAFERLTHKRRFFPGTDFAARSVSGVQWEFIVDQTTAETFRDYFNRNALLTMDRGRGEKYVDCRVTGIAPLNFVSARVTIFAPSQILRL